MSNISLYKKIYNLIEENRNLGQVTLEILLAGHLIDPTFINKNVVLQAMRDLKYKPQSNELIEACLRCMHDRDVLTRNCAVGALFSFGMKEKCFEELKYLKDDYAFEIINYISFNDMIGLD